MVLATGKVVQEYLRLYKSASSNKIAELIVRDVPGLFSDKEKARSAIRYYRGANGEKNRSKLSPELYMPKVSIEASDEPDYEPFVLDDSAYPMIVGGDAHIPYHDQDALELFIERAYAIKASMMILAGDWLDMYQISRFNKDPRRRSIKDEMHLFHDILSMIRKLMPKMRIIYKYGNHEERWDNYLMTNAPALYGLESMRLEAAEELGLAKLGVEIVSNKRIIRAGHLNIIHGHEYIYSISSPVNPARGLYNRAKKSALCFHHHQSSEHTETAINGDVASTWSGGCLCGLHPEYMPLNRWNLGFTEITQDDGFFRVSNRKIINYRIV